MPMPGSGNCNAGLARMARNASGVAGTGTTGTFGGTLTMARYIMTGAVDDSTGNFEAAHTSASGIGGTARTIGNFADVFLDSFPTIASQTVTHLFTIPTGSGNFAISGITMHDDTTTNVTSTSTTLVCGIALGANTLFKTLAFSILFTLTELYTDNSGGAGNFIVNLGLQRTGRNASMVGGASTVGSAQSVTRYVQTMLVDNSSSNFEAAHTTAAGAGGGARTITESLDQILDGAATISGQTTTHTCTFATGSANFTDKIRGISLHDDTVGNTTTTSSTLYLGIAGQAWKKTSLFALVVVISILWTDNS